MNGDHKLTTADVHQMAGRGTRSQGIPTATIIMIGAKIKVSVMAVLLSNDDAGAVNTVPGNVRRLYDRWPSLTKEKTDVKRKRIAEALRNDAWMQRDWPLVQEDLEWLHGQADGKTSRKSKTI
jgi:hypothetical protein